MTISIEEAKTRLDSIINKARTDLYKPIHIAEVLRRSRLEGCLDPLDLESYRKKSIHWRNEVTQKLTGKASSSSSKYQDDVWNQSAMPPQYLKILDNENKATAGAVERYIYARYGEKQGMVSDMIAAIENTTPETFKLHDLLQLFKAKESGLRRSIDKAYEIVTYSLLETIVVGLELIVKVQVPERSYDLLNEFADLTKVLIGIDTNIVEWEEPAHIYRVGVTNAADRGLDMWANFGPAVQVKHLTLDQELAKEIVDQIESDHIVIVCRDVDADVIQIILQQIGWGRRVRGIIKESNLIEWYERCFRGNFAYKLASPLLQRLKEGFYAEFPQSTTLFDLLADRGYLSMQIADVWKTGAETPFTLK